MILLSCLPWLIFHYIANIILGMRCFRRFQPQVLIQFGKFIWIKPCFSLAIVKVFNFLISSLILGWWCHCWYWWKLIRLNNKRFTMCQVSRSLFRGAFRSELLRLIVWYNSIIYSICLLSRSFIRKILLNIMSLLICYSQWLIIF